MFSKDALFANSTKGAMAVVESTATPFERSRIICMEALRFSSERPLRMNLYSPELHVNEFSPREIFGRCKTLIEEGVTTTAADATGVRLHCA